MYKWEMNPPDCKLLKQAFDVNQAGQHGSTQCLSHFQTPRRSQDHWYNVVLQRKSGHQGGGVYLKHHARLCAQGTYAPTGLKEETKGPVSVAAEDNLEIHKMDAIAGFPTGVPKCVSFCYEYLMDFT